MNETIATSTDRPITPAIEAQTRKTRKPSPGLAARLKALGFGADKRLSTPLPLDHQIGRLPEHQIQKIDNLLLANAERSIEIQRRGRAWSGASGRLTPQVTGGSFAGSPAGRLTPQFTGGSFIVSDYRLDSGRRMTTSTIASEPASLASMDMAAEEMDGQKYRLPDHINGNGTKATPETKKAHIESAPETKMFIESAPPYEESQPPTPITKDPPKQDYFGTDGQVSSTIKQDANANEQDGNEQDADGQDANGRDAETNEQEANTIEQPEPSPDEVPSYFNPLGLQRPGSIYTLSRVSFANQLAQLTSLSLPDADYLESQISGIPMAPVATTHLISIANSMRAWCSRAAELLAGLDADDDVEWAAAGGREGLEEVDSAVVKFEKLINVYVGAIEELQKRSDAADVSKSKMTTLVTQTESILSEWGQIRKKLRGVKEQVELAMEWEDIWNVVLGDIGNEMGALNRLVFEIEEKRHKTIVLESSGGIDPAELDTIAERFPQTDNRPSPTTNRFLPTGFPVSPNSPDLQPSMGDDDSSLMALSARLQPLHASLTFVPIRLSTYVPRAEKLFPTACQELETRRLGLERDWLRLKADADSLQQELGEDKWIQVFRNANRSAERMVKSIEKAIAKIKEATETGQHLINPNGMAKKVDAYMKRKMHFGSAIEKVLTVIGNGLKDRLTVNGEISRMHQDTQARWDALRERLFEIDQLITELQEDNQNLGILRDSMSTIVSGDAFSMPGSPSSSPASSVIEGNRGNGGGNKGRRSSLPRPPGGQGRRSVGGSTMSSTQKKTPASRVASRSSTSTPGPGSSRQNSYTPQSSGRLPRPSPNPASDKPRWNSSVKTQDLPPRSHTSLGAFSTPPPRGPTPSMRTSRSVSHTPSTSNITSPKESKIPLRSPLSREATSSASSPMTARESTPSRATGRNSSLSASTGANRKVSFSDVKSVPGPYSQQVLSLNRPRLAHKPSMPAMNQSSNLRSSFSSSIPNKRQTIILPSIEQPDDMSPMSSPPELSRPTLERRAVTSMGSRRSSLLPTPRGRQDSFGRESSLGLRARRESSLMSNDGSGGSGSAGSGGDRPRWRPI